MSISETINGKKYYTDLPEEDRKSIKTLKKWATSGYVPMDENSGAMLYPNRYSKTKCHYLKSCEVKRGSSTETEKIRKARSEQNKKRYELKKAEKAELEAKVSDLNKRLELLSRGYTNACRAYGNSLYNLNKVSPVREIVLDVETTGLSPCEDEILQISILDANTEEILFNSYIRPCRTVSWYEAWKIHGITSSDVSNAPMLHEVLPEIVKAVRHTTKIIGYSIEFDIGFLEQAGVTFPKEAAYCDVAEMFAQKFGEWDDYHQNFNLKKLTECAKYFGYNWEGKPHDSIADCIATLFCYRKLQLER